jgi:thiol-disulfide isomerase/thioredoxin
MGVQFRPATDRQRESLRLGVGAATVQAVYPDSPAKAAGLEIGDVIVGPAGQRFTEPQQLREWVMTAPLDRPIPLDIMRHGVPRQVALTPRAYPRKWPELPGPPKPGTPAPALGLAPYRGTPPAALAANKETLLFFWATWCGICKTALPDLEKARARARPHGGRHHGRGTRPARRVFSPATMARFRPSSASTRTAAPSSSTG